MSRAFRHVRKLTRDGRWVGLAVLGLMVLAACAPWTGTSRSPFVGLEPQPVAGELPEPVGLARDARPAAGRPAPPVPVRRPGARDDLATLQALLDRGRQRSLAVPELTWPAAGRILAGFGARRDGGRNDGIDIGVADGAAVLAAADGLVVYAGGSMAGYGAMLLVRHAGEFTTVYAHNRALLVKAGDRVARAQPIALAGRADAAGVTRLHFQLRAAGKPVDPAPYLRLAETLMASAAAN